MAGGRIGVIGAGQMGAGIAHVAAVAGYEVCLLDTSPGILDRAMAAIIYNLERQISRGTIEAEHRTDVLARIHPEKPLPKTRPSSGQSTPGYARCCSQKPFSPPIPQPFPSPGWRQQRTGQPGSWACIL
ncbi:MAG: 3-hydroxybutyryl-CoA dehydrogenase [Rhodospirillaceae bacterium]|nr:MAG: 3-hydroxybutyryl-CoA dehydrogenase [Rhodospirillaceae bacterium]